MCACRKSDAELDWMLRCLKAAKLGLPPPPKPPPPAPIEASEFVSVENPFERAERLRAARGQKQGSRKGKPNKHPRDEEQCLKAARSQEVKSDAMLPELVRAQIRKQRMRPFFAKHYKGFAEFYTEKHEDLGWNQAFSPEDCMPDIQDGRGGFR